MIKLSSKFIASAVFLIPAIAFANPDNDQKELPATSGLQEMSDASLADLEAKSGITIDMEYRWKIGEVLWRDTDDRKPRAQTSGLVAPEPSRYIPPVVVNGQELNNP